MKVEAEKLRRIVIEELKADAAYETVLPEMTSKIPLIPPPPAGYEIWRYFEPRVQSIPG